MIKNGKKFLESYKIASEYYKVKSANVKKIRQRKIDNPNAGYNPNDRESLRVSKAYHFAESMVRNGQQESEAYDIACKYYKVDKNKVLDYKVYYNDGPLDDFVFMIDGAIPVEASEIFDNGDFC